MQMKRQKYLHNAFRVPIQIDYTRLSLHLAHFLIDLDFDDYIRILQILIQICFYGHFQVNGTARGRQTHCPIDVRETRRSVSTLLLAN